MKIKLTKEIIDFLDNRNVFRININENNYVKVFNIENDFYIETGVEGVYEIINNIKLLSIYIKDLYEINLSTNYKLFNYVEENNII